MKNEIANLKVLFRRTMHSIAQSRRDLAEIKRQLATKDDIAALCARMDGFSAQLREDLKRGAY